MTDERKLMEIKRSIEQNEKQIQKNEGRLESLFDKVKNTLNLSPDSSDKTVLKEINTKVHDLKETQKKDKERLSELMEVIEEETEQWND